ncbi:replication initiation protein RepC (plasmid) [Microvirga ossetica]|uniref:Replication initiation protein RepC n=1 Tax=Microvirga ossetica TaxID=1882682 RepID=A0A1B2EZY5_9HYPH|nr:plasmid replication protein RepC [Microvirga ossetica]ANY85541.1 replication initiation protein RepC [Microvirga ossetica]
MEPHRSTSPAGRRPLSLAMMAARAVADACPPDTIIRKWTVLDHLREAKKAVGVSDRALAVLHALLTFHPETTLTAGEGLVVFPSNYALSHRANGMAPTTLRRNLADLVEAGLIIRRDSPNGKRYARKGEGGQIEQAFGFDLGPLVARAGEFARLAKEARDRAKARHLLREEISILRRDLSKTITAALAEGLDGPWEAHRAALEAAGPMPARNADYPALEAYAAILRPLWANVDKSLRDNVKAQKVDTNESRSGRHHKSQNPESLLEEKTDFRRNDEGEAPKPRPAPPSLRLADYKRAAPSGRGELPMPSRPPAPVSCSLDLGLVVRVCPDIGAYARGGQGIRSWRDLLDAADLARSALGIAPDAWREARAVMGDEQASVVIAVILQRHETIRIPGGYLRGLIERARAGRFTLRSVLLALLRSSMNDDVKQHT